MIHKIINRVIDTVTKKTSDYLKNYHTDKDGIVPKINNIGGKNGRKEIKSRKNH
jgi:hypothetical protein